MEAEHDQVDKHDDEALHQRLKAISLLRHQDPLIRFEPLLCEIHLAWTVLLFFFRLTVPIRTTTSPESFVSLVLVVLPRVECEIRFGNF